MANLKDVLAKETLLACNVDDFTIFKAIVGASEGKAMSLIMQLSPSEVDWWGLVNFARLVGSRQEHKQFFLGIDHGRAEGVVKEAIGLGFDMVHFDGSSLPLEKNIEETKINVTLAHKHNVLVEGEPSSSLTDPKEALLFCQKTGVDLIAVFVGNKHGMDEKNPERLDLGRLKEIKKTVGNFAFLTLHGGSGVVAEDLNKAIEERLIAKVNINTQLRKAYFEGLSQSIKDGKTDKVYELLDKSRALVQKEVERLLSITGDHDHGKYV